MSRAHKHISDSPSIKCGGRGRGGGGGGEGEEYEEMSSSIFLPTAEHHVSLAYRKYFSLSEELNANA